MQLLKTAVILICEQNFSIQFTTPKLRKRELNCKLSCFFLSFFFFFAEFQAMAQITVLFLLVLSSLCLQTYGNGGSWIECTWKQDDGKDQGVIGVSHFTSFLAK